jgi:hypothetical protein
MRRVAIDRRAAARYGVRVGDVLDTVNALGGITAGEVREGALSYAIQVRFDPTTRAAPEVLDNLPVATLDGRTVPLSQVASIENDPGPAQVSHEDVSRRVTIQANVRGRDLASFVAEARARVGREVRLPPGYRVEWGGQFEQLEAATERLAVVIPLAPRPHLRLALHELRRGTPGRDHLPERALRRDGRRPRARRARHAVLDLGGGGLHRALRRRRPERSGAGFNGTAS